MFLHVDNISSHINCYNMQAYLIKAAPRIVAANQLPGLLGVFQKLIASKALDHEGYKLLDSMMEHVRLDGLQQYLPTVSHSMTLAQLAVMLPLIQSRSSSCLELAAFGLHVTFIPCSLHALLPAKMHMLCDLTPFGSL